MNKFSLFISLILLSGCGMTLTDAKWADERIKYKEQCLAYNEEFKKKMNEGVDKTASSSDSVKKVCEKYPALCNPPKKSDDLLFYEDMGKPYTQEACLDY